MADEPSEPTPESNEERDRPATPDHEPKQEEDKPLDAPPDPQEQRDRLIKPSPEEEEEGGPVKSFLEHLEDLRWVLIKIIASVLVCMTICMVAAPKIVQFLK